MPIYVYKENKQISTNAIRNNKAVKAIYAKEQGQGTVCVWGIDNVIMFTYTVTDNKITITGLAQNKEPTSLIIPAQIEGLTVTAIDSYAFHHATQIKEVFIPDSVTRIGSDAFRGCAGLTSITIPNSVTSIGSSAFSECSGLKSVTIGSGVTSIGSAAFSGCSSLESITIPFVGAKAGVTSSDTYQYPFGYIFGTASYTGGIATKQSYNGKMVELNGSSFLQVTETTYYIPSALKSVTVTGGNILRGSFSNCSKLTSITLPNNISKIEMRAFYGCTSLVDIKSKPSSITRIGEDAFYNTAWYNSQPNGIVYFDKVAYKYKGTMPSNTSIVIKNGTLGIGNSAFSGCDGLTSIIIPDSVTSIGMWAFSDCSGLTSITIGSGVTSIEKSAFDGCYDLTSVHISDIAKWCAISFEDSYANPLYYGHNLYVNGELIKDLIIPNGVTGIRDYAFYGCTNVTSITIPNSVTSISKGAFEGCDGLTSVTIPDSVTNVGNSAFYGCGLTSVTIGSGVTRIEKFAFARCTSLISITFNGTKAQWNAITKVSGWDDRAGNFTIHCTDGDISK